ncbi:hypothetical protein QMZ30_10545 [Pantoea sp. EA-12]|uniref:hypothetical protein n=1 Tax=Pantoea sp. EA-12 TaxID=3043303 RepID=UPI0024B557C3|nr:hypothetical protein [Pantoea sp. EA-12]MDI9221340.1 hypothetical protein [Pantoea sp. EA-12]
MNSHGMQVFCDGIQLLKLYNKLTSRLVDADRNGTAHNNKAAGLLVKAARVRTAVRLTL